VILFSNISESRRHKGDTAESDRKLFIFSVGFAIAAPPFELNHSGRNVTLASLFLCLTDQINSPTDHCFYTNFLSL